MLESRTAVAYGGSFIAYELCDGFAMRKLHTTRIMPGPYWLRSCLDPDGGEVVCNIAQKFGVEVIHKMKKRSRRWSSSISILMRVLIVGLASRLAMLPRF
jgi:hypothetical protein